MRQAPLRLAILGSTGSLGETVLSVVRACPTRLRVVGLATGTNVERLGEQIHEFHPFMGSFARGAWQRDVAGVKGFRFVSESEMVTHPEVDVVVVASVGKAGLEPTVRAIQAGKRIALGNKETLAMIGSLLPSMARSHGGEVLPLDTETVGVWQLLQGEKAPVRRLILTSSWGPFRSGQLRTHPSPTPEEVATHPARRLGRKRAIDATTLMSKAIQILEAHTLFDIPLDDIVVVYHPENVVRAIVEFDDGNAKALFAPGDPHLAVQSVLLFPERVDTEKVARLSLATLGQLTFQPLDTDQFPVYRLALAAVRGGHTYPAVISAANEVAVDLFLSQQIGFRDISSLLQRAMAAHQVVPHPSLEEIIAADQWARDFMEQQVPE